MVDTRYEQYLHSHNWQLRVIRKLAMNSEPTDFQKLWMLHHEKTASSIRFRCDDCSGVFAREDIEIHHVTYKRIFQEHPRDLRVLCGKCHKLRHGLDAAGQNLYRLLARTELDVESTSPQMKATGAPSGRVAPL